jgi:hypothetical protein
LPSRFLQPSSAFLSRRNRQRQRLSPTPTILANSLIDAVTRSFIEKTLLLTSLTWRCLRVKFWGAHKFVSSHSSYISKLFFKEESLAARPSLIHFRFRRLAKAKGNRLSYKKTWSLAYRIPDTYLFRNFI